MLNRSSTAVATLLTFWPPGPDPRTKRSSKSRSSSESVSLMGIIGASGASGVYNLRTLDRRDFLTLRGLHQRQRGRQYVLSCEWLYNRCLDRRLSQHGDLERAVFDEEAIRLVFDELDDRFRNIETVGVTKMEWLVGEIRSEFGNLMRAFR